MRAGGERMEKGAVVVVRAVEPERLAGDAETLAELCHLHNEVVEALAAAVRWNESLQAQVNELKRGT